MSERQVNDEAMSEHHLRIDCHVHTRGSFDSTASIDTVLESAAEADLDGIVVTDHDAIEHSLAAANRAPAYGLVGLPGVEVSTADGHLLAIGVERCPSSGRSFDATVTQIREAGGVAVVPHPFQRSRHGVTASAIADCDGVEVFNAHSLTGVRNRQAARFADRHGYPKFGGSDAHRPNAVGWAYTEVDVDAAPSSHEAVLDAMRAGHTRAGGRPTPKRVYVRKWAENAKLKSRRLLPVE